MPPLSSAPACREYLELWTSSVCPRRCTHTWEEAAQKLAGLICSFERQTVLTLTAFPFPFKDELFPRVSSLAQTEQVSQTRLLPPVTFIPH